MCYGVGETRAARLNSGNPPDGTQDRLAVRFQCYPLSRYITQHYNMHQRIRLLTPVFFCVCGRGLFMHEMHKLPGPNCSLGPVLEKKNPHHLWVQHKEQGPLWPHDVPQEPTHQGLSSCRLSKRRECVLLCNILKCASLLVLIIHTLVHDIGKKSYSEYRYSAIRIAIFSFIHLLYRALWRRIKWENKLVVLPFC